MHRVKLEIQLGHLEAALNLLVETVKLALSVNDNNVILESTLLFLRLAGIMGNYTKEQRLAEKAVISSFKHNSIKSLSIASLFYTQAHLVGPM